MACRRKFHTIKFYARGDIKWLIIYSARERRTLLESMYEYAKTGAPTRRNAKNTSRINAAVRSNLQSWTRDWSCRHFYNLWQRKTEKAPISATREGMDDFLEASLSFLPSNRASSLEGQDCLSRWLSRAPHPSLPWFREPCLVPLPCHPPSFFLLTKIYNFG